MKKQPLGVLLISLIGGIVLQEFFSLSTEWIYVLLGGSLLSFFIILIRNFYLFKIRNLLFCFFFFALGVSLHAFYNRTPALPKLQKRETVVFKMTKKLNSNTRNRRYEVTCWRNKDYFKSILSVPRAEEELDFEHYYVADLTIRRIEKPYADFQFDYRKYMARRQVFFQSYLPGAFKTVKRNDLSVAEKIRQSRLDILHKINRSALSDRTREFTKGIILADRTDMDSGTLVDFRNSGMMHLLAISGTHMAIIFGSILYFLKLLIPAGYRNQRIILALLLIWLFALFIDFGNSVVRSCIMISVYYCMILLQRKPDLIHALSLAGLIILLIDTNQFFDVGFQLSFIAVLGIYWFNAALQKCFPKPKNNIQRFLLNILTVSLSAQIGTLPLVIFYFHQYSWISLIANLVILPFAQIVIILSLIMALFLTVGFRIPIAEMLFDKVIIFMLEVVRFFASKDFAMVKMVPLSFPELILSFVFLYFCGLLLKRITLKNGMMAGGMLFLFITLRILLNFQAAQKDEVVEHLLFKNKILSVKSGSQVNFYCAQDTNQERMQQYIVEPYLTWRRTRSYQVVTLKHGSGEIKIRDKIYVVGTEHK